MQNTLLTSKILHNFCAKFLSFQPLSNVLNRFFSKIHLSVQTGKLKSVQILCLLYTATAFAVLKTRVSHLARSRMFHAWGAAQYISNVQRRFEASNWRRAIAQLVQRE